MGAIQRPVMHRRRYQHLEASVLWHEGVFDAEVVARRTAKAGCVPGVVNGDLRPRDEQHPRQMIALLVAVRLVAVEDHALADEPVCVAAAAREAPAPGHAIARLW